MTEVHKGGDAMFCPYCGEKIIDNAKFCSQCGKRLREETAPAQEENAAPVREHVFPKSEASPGKWTAETELGVIEPFSMPVASLILERIAEGRYQFLILTPPEPVSNCRFMQFCSDDQGKLHAELAMAKGEGTVIRAADQVGIRDAVLMTEAFMKETLPSFPNGSRRSLF